MGWSFGLHWGGDVVGFDRGADGGSPALGVVLVFAGERVVGLAGAEAVLANLIDENVGVELVEAD